MKKVISLAQIDNCIMYGGIDGAERKIAIVFPEKMRAIIESDNFKFDTVFSAFHIKIPEIEVKNFNHSVYLGGIIKLGIKREKIGDIIVESDGAKIIVKKEIEKFLFANIKTLTRFRDSDVDNISLNELGTIEKKFEELKLITSSLRLDNIVAELAKTSRSKANEIIEQDRVLVNYEQEKKNTKIIKIKDIVTIRGKGKFIIEDIVGNTKKGNYIVIIKKYA